MEIIRGVRVRADERGLLIRAPYQNAERFIKREYGEVQIGLEDGRKISPEQRRKSYALMGEIAEWAGYEPDEIKETMKHEFRKKIVQSLDRELFSLSNCDMTTAREFISYLVDFILRNDVPTHVPLADLADDIDRYVYSCLIRKKCAVCGGKADLHHVDAVGMGNDRTKVNHIGRRCLPLCRGHHDEIHRIGTNSFLSRYHLKAGIIDERIVKAYSLRGKRKENRTGDKRPEGETHGTEGNNPVC